MEVRSADRFGGAIWDHSHGDLCWDSSEKAEGRGTPEDRLCQGCQESKTPGQWDPQGKVPAGHLVLKPVLYK